MTYHACGTAAEDIPSTLSPIPSWYLRYVRKRPTLKKSLGDTETLKFENLFEQSDVKTAYYR